MTLDLGNRPLEDFPSGRHRQATCFLRVRIEVALTLERIEDQRLSRPEQLSKQAEG